MKNFLAFNVWLVLSGFISFSVIIPNISPEYTVIASFICGGISWDVASMIKRGKID